MNKKLLLTSALVGSVALTGFANAETKITGDLEVTLTSTSSEAAASNTGSSDIGREMNIILSAGNDTSLGALTYGGKFTVDGVAASGAEWYTTISNGNFAVSIGQDMGAGSDNDGTVAPHVSDQADTLMRGTGSYTSSSLNPYGKAHVGAEYKALGGKFGVTYAPNNANAIAESAAVGNGDSAYEFGYTGSPIGMGISVAAFHAETNGDATSGTAKYNKFGVAYANGPFAVGGQVQDYSNGLNAGSQADISSTAVSATFTANDNLSIGVGQTTTNRSSDAAGNVEEKINFVTVGYNLGGLGVDLSVANVDNASFSQGADYQVIQLRTVNKF
jgi:hypothetical protein